MKPYALAGTCLLTITSTLAVQGTITAQRIPTLTLEQEEILGHLSIVYLDDGQGGTAKTIRVEGVNVQVVNGLGATETTNGVGNLIVGYQELGNTLEDDARTGSHYVVVGRHHNFTSFAGLLVGENSVASGMYASVTGGRRNRASGNWSTVVSGGFNHAASQGTVVVGGDFNFSAGDSSVVVGGSGNQAVSPGGGGTANKAVVVGGFNNQARAQGSVLVGGRYNDTTANYSAILAGAENVCVGNPQGGGSYCAVVGGQGNQTEAVDAAVVSGGMGRSAAGPHDWVAGELLQDD